MPSADRPSDTVCSYRSVHDQLGAKTKSYATKYKQFVIDYALEWEKVVNGRIQAGIKKAELLRRDLDHYQKKVESLRLAVNQAMAKGKNVKSDTQEKLRRNEEKYMAAKQSYNIAATDLCILMEEVTERSWRDLHPMLIKVAQFDSTLANDESNMLSNLNQVVNKLKEVATANGLSPQPRLKDLASLKPELLSTRPGGVGNLTIESGLAPLGGSAVTSPMGSSTSTALSPGSVGPQGLGGFPVQIAEASPMSAPLPASFDFDSPTSLSMLTISGSSAPAPTLDDVYSANRSSNQSAPNSGNLPPLAPMSSGYAPQRSTSFNLTMNRSMDSSAADDSSAYSGYSSSYYSAPGSLTAAPMMAPPPPPSMPPPPPPMSYGIVPAPSSGSYGMDSYGQPPSQQPPMPSYNYGAPSPGYNYAPPPPQPVQGNTNPFNY